MTRAIHYSDRNAMVRDAVPGSFWIGRPDPVGDQPFWFICPCGCGDRRVLTVGNGFKPDTAPSWRWNGLTDAVELTPSVNMQGHWHGWLRAGEWQL